MYVCPHAWHISYPSDPSWFDNPNKHVNDLQREKGVNFNFTNHALYTPPPCIHREPCELLE